VQWIADDHRQAGAGGQPVDETVQLRSAARDDDPLHCRTRVRSGVVVERPTDLVHEVLGRGGHGARDHRQLLTSAVRGEVLLHPLGLLQRHAELLGDGVGHVLTAHQQNPDEPWHACAVHHDIGHPSTDVDQCLGSDGEVRLPAHRPKHGERRQVDARDVQPGVLGAADVREDGLALGRDEQAAQHPGTVGVRDLLQREEVQHGLLDRDREKVGDVKGQAATQLRLGHPRQIHLPHDHPLIRHPDHDPFVREPGGRPQVLERRRDGFFVHDLAVAHRTVREHDLAEAVEGGSASTEGQLRRPDH
jgi:hypothetical protein